MFVSTTWEMCTRTYLLITLFHMNFRSFINQRLSLFIYQLVFLSVAKYVDSSNTMGYGYWWCLPGVFKSQIWLILDIYFWTKLKVFPLKKNRKEKPPLKTKKNVQEVIM